MNNPTSQHQRKSNTLALSTQPQKPGALFQLSCLTFKAVTALPRSARSQQTHCCLQKVRLSYLMKAALALGAALLSHSCFAAPRADREGVPSSPPGRSGMPRFESTTTTQGKAALPSLVPNAQLLWSSAVEVLESHRHLHASFALIGLPL